MSIVRSGALLRMVLRDSRCHNVNTLVHIVSLYSSKVSVRIRGCISPVVILNMPTAFDTEVIYRSLKVTLLTMAFVSRTRLYNVINYHRASEGTCPGAPGPPVS